VSTTHVTPQAYVGKGYTYVCVTFEFKADLLPSTSPCCRYCVQLLLQCLSVMLVVQAKYWSCLRGLVPPSPPVSPIRTDYRLYPQVNAAGTQFVALAAQQSPKVARDLSPSHVVNGNGGSHLHDVVHQLSGEDDASLKMGSHLVSHHASHGISEPLHKLQSNSTEDSNSHQVAELGHDQSEPPGQHGNHVIGIVSDNANVRAHSPVHQAAGHEQLADHDSTHGHRLLAEGQEPQAHAAKAVHRTKPSPQMCQSKSHQRLLLMRELHVSAHKQMKRQQKHAHHLHACAAVKIRRQKSI